MGDVGTSLTVALAAARHEAIDAETTQGDATACRVLGELLGLDAAWILDAHARGHEWPAESVPLAERVLRSRIDG